MVKKITFSLFLLISISLGLLAYPRQKIKSIPPSNVSDTLSSSQLSYFARLGAGNTEGSNFVRIATSGNPSNTTNNLFDGDIIGIGQSNATNTIHLYTVTDIGNTSYFQVGVGLSAVSSFAGSYVVATRSAIHTIAFTPQSNEAGGAWEFLIKATSRDGEVSNDGMPDQEGFDLGGDAPGGPTIGTGTRLKAADITCPFGATASVGTTAVIGTSSYHVILCDMGAGVTNPVGTSATVVIGRDLSTGSQLINPSAAVGRPVTSEGIADVYNFFVRHRDASDALIDADTMQGRIAVVESVRVTATVDPTLTFIIDNVNVGAGQTICGNTLGTAASNTTATQVAFGSLQLAAFNDLAQRLSCVTNSRYGYVVTAYESKPMTNISSGTTIPDTDCDAGTCNATTQAAWITDNSTSQWGYAMQNISSSTIGADYGGTGLFNAKAFGLGAANAQMIMRNTSTPTVTERSYMCYRITASTTQEAGKYESQIIYTATATF